MNRSKAAIVAAALLSVLSNGQGLAQTIPPSASVWAEKIGTGLAVTSTGTPAVSATYGVTPSDQAKIAAISLYIVVNNRFPAGRSELPWSDLFGTPRLFTTTTQFQAFATAVADYVAAVELALRQQNGVFPDPSATIP